MSACFASGPSRELGLASTLHQVDCFAAQTGGGMFDRLFGPNGGLSAALTIALTLYVAWLAIGLLMGRSALRLSMLTPRMLGLGMILTLATSWVAYQTVVWTLLTSAPDQIAGALLGTRGSAVFQFALRLDAMFTAISSSAQSAAGAVTTQPGVFTPTNMLWTAALLMLFGSLGVLLVARIALTALLGLGPVFVVLGLFPGTRGLLDGWIKAAVMCSLTQLLSVLIGSEALALLTPTMLRMAAAGGSPSMHDALSMLLASTVFVTLMGIALKASSTIVSGWRPTATAKHATETIHAPTQAAISSQSGVSNPIRQAATEIVPAASDQARISSVVTAVGKGALVVRGIGVANGTAGERPAVTLPHQTVVAQNRRIGDRLRDSIGRPAASAPVRTLFR